MNKKQTEFSYAFPKTIPVMAGYLFLGAAYGILMKINGLGIISTAAMSMFVYAGSLQYVAVNLLAAGASPLYGFLMALMINARHLFYGISMLDKYRDMKKWKQYLIFALTDETFSVVCNENVPKELDSEKVFLYISLLDQCYWILGSVLGALMGSMISFNTEGLDFALTALFVVIFTDQWNSVKNHGAALIGVLSSVVCLVVFGKDAFIIPAMLLIMAAIGVCYRKEEKAK